MSSFLEVHLARGVTFWVPTHAPQPLVTRPGSVSTFLSYYAHGSPLAWPSPGSYLSQGFPRGGVGTSRVRLPPTGTRTMALKPPFSSLHYYSEVPGPEASLSVPWPLVVSPPPRSFLPAGIGGDTVDVSTWRCLILTTPQPGEVSTRRRLNLATPYPGDASTWRRLILATPHPGDASTSRRLNLSTP